MSNHNERHQFACYYEHLSSVVTNELQGSTVHLEHAALAHRINSVLRMRAGEDVVLFDNQICVSLTLTDNQSKKMLSGIVRHITHTASSTPFITVVLPVLKREALEDALYSCVELGANAIILVTTSKTHKFYGDEKQLLRLRAILIAAAEQSKNFVIPTLTGPLPLQQAIDNLDPSSTRLLFHPDGTHLMTIAQQLDRTKNICLMVGPEADCTTEERTMLITHGFALCALTPTVLRAQQALTVGLGALRSLL